MSGTLAGTDRTEAEDHFLDWLRDAHAMEEQAETMLKAQASRIEKYPALRERIERHIGETQEQARIVKGLIDRRGSGRSIVKDAAGKLMATMQGIGGMFAADEVVKGSLASYAFEHFEVASYRMLAAAADALGDAEAAQACRRIMAEEQAMADWLAEHSDEVTLQYLHLETAGESGKR